MGVNDKLAATFHPATEPNIIHAAEREEHKNAVESLCERERGYFEDNDMR